MKSAGTMTAVETNIFLLTQRRHKNTTGFFAILSELVTQLAFRGLPACHLVSFDKAKHRTKFREGTLLLVMIMLDSSYFPLYLSCGPSEKLTQSTRSHFSLHKQDTGQLSHWNNFYSHNQFVSDSKNWARNAMRNPFPLPGGLGRIWPEGGEKWTGAVGQYRLSIL